MSSWFVIVRTGGPDRNKRSDTIEFRWRPRRSPRLASDRLLSSLPPATIVTAGFDPLRDDGAAYADRLTDAGVPVTYGNYTDVIHGFFGMLESPTDLAIAREAQSTWRRTCTTFE